MSKWRKVAALLMTAVMVITGMMPYTSRVYANTGEEGNDVSGLIQTNSIATLSQEGVDIAPGGAIDSSKEVTVKGSFKVPVIGDGNESGYVKKNDYAFLQEITGFELSEAVTKDLSYDNTKVGEITFSPVSGGGISTKVVFNGADEVFAGETVSGSSISGVSCSYSFTMKYVSTGSETAGEEKEVTILDKTYTVTIPVVATKIEGKKTATRNGQYINWKVELTCTPGNDKKDTLDGYQFEDDLTDAGEYVADSFNISWGEDQSSKPAEEKLTVPTETKKMLSYNIDKDYLTPAEGETTAKVCLTYQTKIPDAIFYQESEQTLKNSAKVVKDESTCWEGEAEVTLDGNWITKKAKVTDEKTGEITWTITVNSEKAAISGAAIVDKIDENMEVESAELYYFDDGGKVTVTIGNDGEPIELKPIKDKVVLTIVAKAKDACKIGHNVLTIKNTACLEFQDHKYTSNETTITIGKNPILKTAGDYDATTHRQTWTVTISKSDCTENLTVSDLILHGTSLPDEYKGTDTKLSDLVSAVGQRYVEDSFQAASGSALTLQVESITDASGSAIGELLTVTGENGKGIDPSSQDQTFTFQTECLDESIFFSNYYGGEDVNGTYTYFKAHYLTNKAVLFDQNGFVNESNASKEIRLCLLDKNCMSAADASKDLTQNGNANASIGLADNAFDYQNHSIVFRIHVNGANVPTSGAITISDELPEGWTFGNVTDEKQFLIYKGFSNENESSRIVRADTIVTGPAFQVTTDEKTEKETMSCTFENGFEKGESYLILVKAVATEAAMKEYTDGNSKKSMRNYAYYKVGNRVFGDYEDVNITSKSLDKQLISHQDSVLTWQVVYNPYLVSYDSTTLTDTLPEGIEIRTDSKGNLDLSDSNIVIRKMVLNQDGSLSEGEVVTDIKDMVSYQSSLRLLTFQIPNDKTAYQITYVTDVTGEPGTKVTNNVVVTGKHTTTEPVTGSYQIQDADANAIMVRSGWLRITKVDNQTEAPLSGAAFTLLAEDGTTVIRQGTTDTKGIVTLRGIPVGTYLLKETGAPDGYNIDDTIHHVVVAKDNAGNLTTTIDQKTENINQLVVTDVKTGTVGNLMVTKILAGNAGETQRDFTFTLTFDSNTETTVDGTYSYVGTGGKADGTLEIKDHETTFTLKGGQSIILKNLPKDLTYSVKENSYEADGYTTTSEGEKGQIIVDQVTRATFTNTKNNSYYSGGYTPQQAVVSLEAVKTLDGEEPTGSDFTFTLSENGSLLQTKQNQNGTVNFDAMTYNNVGTYEYTIAETAGSQENVNYDDTVYTVIVTVTLATDYQAEVTVLKNGQPYEGQMIFANTTNNTDIVDPTTPTTDGNHNQGGTDIPDENIPQSEKPGTAPKTGDSSKNWMFSLLSLASGTAVILLLKKKKH